MMTSRAKTRIWAANGAGRGPQSVAGLTLIEISLALGIAVVLSAVALPAMGGWMEEHKLRSALGEMAEVVMRARMEAEATGESRWVVFNTGEENDDAEAGEVGFFYEVPPGFLLMSLRAENKWKAAPALLRIESGGFLNPRLYRLELGERWINFRFDPLTGHLREEEYSL